MKASAIVLEVVEEKSTATQNFDKWFCIVSMCVLPDFVESKGPNMSIAILSKVMGVSVIIMGCLVLCLDSFFN